MKFISVIFLILIVGCSNEELNSYSFSEETDNWQVSLFVEERPAGENVTEEAELGLKYIGEEEIPAEVEYVIDTEWVDRGRSSSTFEEFDGEASASLGNRYFVQADELGQPFKVEVKWNEQVDEFTLVLEKE